MTVFAKTHKKTINHCGQCKNSSNTKAINAISKSERDKIVVVYTEIKRLSKTALSSKNLNNRPQAKAFGVVFIVTSKCTASKANVIQIKDQPRTSLVETR